MTSADLGKCLGYLKAFYSNWNLDVTNEFVLEVWFQALQDIDYQSFRKMIQQYCASNKFGPTSPNEFLSMIPKTYTSNAAWEIVLDLITRYGDKKEILLNTLVKYPDIYKVMLPLIDMIPNVENDSFGNKTFGYTIGRLFIRNYQKFLNSLNIRYEGDKLITKNNEKLIRGEQQCLN